MRGFIMINGNSITVTFADPVGRNIMTAAAKVLQAAEQAESEGKYIAFSAVNRKKIRTKACGDDLVAVMNFLAANGNSGASSSERGLFRIP